MKKKKTFEFKKFIVVWALGMATLAIIGSGALSYFDHDGFAEVAIAVINICVPIAIAYCSSTTIEKNSRNKYGIDRDGIPYSRKTSDEEIGG